MEQRAKIRRNLLYQLDHPLQQTLKQNTKPSKKDTKIYIQAYAQEEREREREPWGFGEREEVRENLNIHPKIFLGTKHYNL